jgi:hypothetical protein
VGRVDETSGEPVFNYGSEFSMAADKELIENRVYGALNFIYDLEATQLLRTRLWQRGATLGVFASVTTQVRPGIFMGAEARYLHRYEGLGFDPFAGEAFFAPTMYASLTKNIGISAAWNFQVAGRAVDAPGSLDLKNFERHKAKLRLMYNF